MSIVFSIHLESDKLEIIDKASSLSFQSRSEFVMAAALKNAESVFTAQGLDSKGKALEDD